MSAGTSQHVGSATEKLNEHPDQIIQEVKRIITIIKRSPYSSDPSNVQ
jgi:hypothetical protein